MARDRFPARRRRDRAGDALLVHRVDEVGGVDVFSLATAPVARAAPEVVLIHGLAISNRYWRPLIRRLGSDHRVLAPDLPGVGRSSSPDRPLTVLDVVDGLVAWMDAVGLQRPVLVGHSLGCEVVAVLAARHPERVAALVLASPGGDAVQRPLVLQALRLLADGFRERPSMLLTAGTDYLRVGTRSMLQAIREARRWKASDVVGHVHQPTLVVQGGRDLLVSSSWPERLADLLPDGALVRLADAPHGLPWSSPDDLARVVRTFRDDSRDAGRGALPA